MFGAVVGPQNLLKDQFGIGRFPKQEVRYPLLATGPHDQIRSRPASGQAGGQRRLVDVARLQPASLGFFRQGPRRIDDVGLAAVVEGDLQQETVVMGGAGLGAVDDLQDIDRKVGAAAKDTHPDALAAQTLQVALDVALEQPHQFGNLGPRPAPVLGRKAEHCQAIDANLSRALDCALQRLDACPMAKGARQTARTRPAAVAVHDQRHVQGRALRLGRP